MTKLKDSALLDAFIHNLSCVYTLPAEVLANPDNLDVELDLGCGKGSFTTELAKRHPERIILAADVLSGIIGAWLALRTINALIANQKKTA